MLARSNPTLFEQHLEKLELFHRLHNKYSKDMALLVGLLQETPEWARVRDFLPDEDEYQERLNLVSRYGPSMTRFEFVALMFVLPIEVLETYLSRPSLHTDLEGKLRSLKQLVQKFSTRNDEEGRRSTLAIGPLHGFKYPLAPCPVQVSKNNASTAEASGYGDHGLHDWDNSGSGGYDAESMSMQIPKVIWNSRGKSINIFGKGYKCSITGDLYPDLCFVTPLYWNETGDERWLTRGQLNAYNTLFSDGPGVNALVSHEACSQEPWNMICLSSEVRPLWYQCRFGLKYLGSTDQGIDKEVKVQFVWMPLMPGSDTWEMTNVCEEVASGEHDRTIDKLKRVHNISEAQVQDRDGRNMISGRIFSIRVREEDFKLFVAMLKLQGNLVRLAAMSGVAQAVLDECPRSQSPADIWTPGTSEDGHCLSVC